MSKRVYGIDLGTTYSCIACVDEYGKPKVFENDQNQTTTPSVVYFENSSNVVVGQTAVDAVATSPERVVSMVKRYMGDATWERSFDGRTFKPQEVSAFVLRRLAADAERETNEKVEDVVITCPAYFGTNEKEATRQAGTLAGLNVLYVIPEPTAAAIAYGFASSAQDERVILVYDLGGGTFDITVIKVAQQSIEVVATGGDHRLGGKDWDVRLRDYLIDQYCEQTGADRDDIRNRMDAMQELLVLAERTKQKLTNATSTKVKVQIDERVEVELSREKFDDLTADLQGRTASMTAELIERVKTKGCAKIDTLLLVGGSTFMPQIGARMKEFGIDIQQFRPNMAIAEGAALFGHKCGIESDVIGLIAEKTGQAAETIDLDSVPQAVLAAVVGQVAADHGMTIAGATRMAKTRVTNVSSKSFGLVVQHKTKGEVVANLVRRDQQVPGEGTQTFGTFEDGQTGATLRVMENISDEEKTQLSTATEMGAAELTFDKPMPAGSPIEVTFKLGPDGRLTVLGHDPTTGRSITAEFQTAAIMSKEEEEAALSRSRSIAVSS